MRVAGRPVDSPHLQESPRLISRDRMTYKDTWAAVDPKHLLSSHLGCISCQFHLGLSNRIAKTGDCCLPDNQPCVQDVCVHMPARRKSPTIVPSGNTNQAGRKICSYFTSPANIPASHRVRYTSSLKEMTYGRNWRTAYGTPGGRGLLERGELDARYASSCSTVDAVLYATAVCAASSKDRDRDRDEPSLQQYRGRREGGVPTALRARNVWTHKVPPQRFFASSCEHEGQSNAAGQSCLLAVFGFDFQTPRVFAALGG